MQIYNDKKKRIGTITGFKGRAITKTLDSGDKELSFEYPANGAMADLLKEEYYIRTKEDEFVIKAVEEGEQYNKYTAMLNVEELEGQSFPYGFASQEQTINACLTFAFEGTGWTVGTCTVTKRRTIDIEEATTAWGVLQSCLSTYRCECEIDTLQKRINIYAQIGRDRGCYFVEGLNLRKLTVTSDTYEFYTRIIPIGKDGITIEWLNGKEYLENYQYSSKVKTYTWKDERYTNTTSLMEDAEAKLEELSKPYKVYAADVADLAKANQEYKNILDFGIGDTVMMVSKHPRMREKQRIVKIVEYPETPEKNTVELSNTTKTFAEVQKTETELAKTEAISIANSTTKKVLQQYSTTEEIETKITASKESVELGVMHTLESYYDKTETDALIKISKGVIELRVSEIYQTKTGMSNYSTTEEMKALIDITTESVELGVMHTLESYYDKTETDALIKISKSEIELGVSEIYQTKTGMSNYSTTEEMKALIDITADAINLEVSSKIGEVEVKSLIEQKAESIRLKASKIAWASDNSSMSESGILTCTGANIGGSLNGATGTFAGNLSASGGTFAGNLLASGGTFSTINSTGDAGESGAKIGLSARALYAMDASGNYGIFFLFLNKVNMPQDSYDLDIYNCKANGVMLRGNFTVSGGTKSKLASTKNYNDRLLYCYEMPSPMFGDIGEAVTDENGECYIYLDDIFAETVTAEIEYQVFLQKEGRGDIWVEEKNPIYFLVKGTENLKFAWEVKAKQKGYEFERLETPFSLTEVESESESLLENELENYIKEQEGLFYEEAQ